MKYEAFFTNPLDARIIVPPILAATCAYALWMIAMGNVVPFPGTESVPGIELESEDEEEKTKDKKEKNPKKELFPLLRYQTMHWPPACK